ncbi:collagen alpha-1(XXV) chain-like [Erpetoichthys calabaricus]|uniref:collagen alpha-1(XXV) chain-like n=1 Tax=Erpetoichthys calabaricus TaxID=27687 RepID=UPI0022342D02|nr:collagen alpha-1(XXV) chain-like [Erpetoichthys calabaricus]
MEDDQKISHVPQLTLGSTCNAYLCHKRISRSCRDMPAVIFSCTLSFITLGFCILVCLRTSDLQSRVLNFERERDTHLSAWISLDQIEPIILGRLEQLMEEKLSARLPRIRDTRDAPHSCVCPPGPPGARGKRGRNGDPASVNLKI